MVKSVGVSTDQAAKVESGNSVGTVRKISQKHTSFRSITV
jgi:hypothetical protein